MEITRMSREEKMMEKLGGGGVRSRVLDQPTYRTNNV